MYKVILIDDESIIRKGLKSIINWKQLDCEVCAEASDGVEGKELIAKHLPDIIITDIRMPGMDGLSMIKEIKSIVPKSKIIILTGFRNFDYVHEAIKNGAFEFLLKPSKLEELNTVISKAIGELKKENEINRELLRLQELFEKNLPLLREKLLYEIIFEINFDLEDIKSKAELYDLKIDKFFTTLIEIDKEEKGAKQMNQYEKHLYRFGISNVFSQVFSDKFEIVSIPLFENQVAFITTQLDEEISQDEISEKLSYFQEMVKNGFDISVTVAVSSQGNGIMDLSSKYGECREVLNHKIYLGNDSIAYSSDIKQFFKYQDNLVLERIEKQLIEAIKAGNAELVREKLNELINSIKETNPSYGGYIKDYFRNLISSINSIRNSLNVEGDNFVDSDKELEGSKKSEYKDITSLYLLMDGCDDVTELYDIVYQAAISISSKINSYNTRSIKLILKKSLSYMQENYKKQITLNDLAEISYVSTCYLSRMFKKELGKNFVDCLNEIRIDKAKELLGNLSYKTYEIAEMVGIPDSHYFSRLFKRYEKITPSEYRDKSLSH